MMECERLQVNTAMLCRQYDVVLLRSLKILTCRSSNWNQNLSGNGGVDFIWKLHRAL